MATIRRRGRTTDDSSNRRVGFDASWRIAGFDGARFYYELMFEDWRKQFASALRYDADHVVGLDFSHGLLVEWQKTGFRSQEHTPRITGFTNADRVVGSPLGPDAEALYVSQRFERGQGVITPWIELARLSSDTYSNEFHEPIVRLTDGVAEWRYRAGTRFATPISNVLRLEADALVEHVENASFVPDARRESVGIRMTLVWQPRGRAR